MCQDEIHELLPLFREGGEAVNEWRRYRGIRHSYLTHRNVLLTVFNLPAAQLDEYLADWTAAEIAAAVIVNAGAGTEVEQWQHIANMRQAWDEFVVAQGELVERLGELGYTNPNGILNDVLYRRSTSNEIYYYRYGDGYDIDPVR